MVWSNACPLTLHCWLRLQRKELEIGSFAALLPFTLQSAICNLQSAICNVSDCCLNLFVCFHWHFNDLPHHSPTVKFCNGIHRSVSYHQLHNAALQYFALAVYWLQYTAFHIRRHSNAIQCSGWTADTLNKKQNHNNEQCGLPACNYYMKVTVSAVKFATYFKIKTISMNNE